MKTKLLAGAIAGVVAMLVLVAGSQRAPAGSPRPSEG